MREREQKGRRQLVSSIGMEKFKRTKVGNNLLLYTFHGTRCEGLSARLLIFAHLHLTVCCLPITNNIINLHYVYSSCPPAARPAQSCWRQMCAGCHKFLGCGNYGFHLTWPRQGAANGIMIGSLLRVQSSPPTQMLLVRVTTYVTDTCLSR